MGQTHDGINSMASDEIQWPSHGRFITEDIFVGGLEHVFFSIY